MMGPLLRDLDERYQTYVEPFSAAMVMPTVAREAGWETKQMVATDVSLFAAVAGYALAERDLAELEVKLDGQIIDLAGMPVWTQAAAILWTQLLARMEQRAVAEYWQEIVADTYFRRREHMAAIEKGVQAMMGRLTGLSFALETPWDTLARFADDPKAVLVANPPTYKGGYEKFFDTGGRLTWKGVPYEVWDPKHDQQRFHDAALEAKCLVIVQQQAESREAASPRPFYARHLSPGQYVYLWSNRPDEVLALTGGVKVRPRSYGDIAPFEDAPMLPEDYDFDASPCVVRVTICTHGEAAWYKQRWLHRLAGAEGAYNWLVLVDGHVAGVGGYSFKAIQTPYPGVDAKVWAGAVILRFALGAPHESHRLTRLVTRIGLQRETLMLVCKSAPAVMIQAAGADKIVTTEYTRHPESKGLRGLMKLVDRRPDKLDGFRLVYFAEMGDDPAQDSFATWVADEDRYITRRKERT